MPDRKCIPTFLIGGAPRSGTTYLCHALDRHPEVFMAKPFIPEPKVLMSPRKTAAEYYAAYTALFAGAGNTSARGEKTSYYLESEQACERIGRLLPDVRILFIVREPVARAYSNYLWSRKNGLETLSFEQAIELEGHRESPLPPAKAYARPFDYLSRGEYATFAQRYYQVLGREAVAFFVYEDLERRPEALLSEVAAFIGVEPLPFEEWDAGVVNSARETGPPIDPATEAVLRQRMAPRVREFAELTGLDVSAWGYDAPHAELIGAVSGGAWPGG